MTESLKARWRNSGIRGGDTLLLHSNAKRTLRHYRRAGIRLRPEDILDSFLEAVGPDGTLLMPLFNFGFTSGEDFDIRTTPSKMGVLTEIARQHPDAVRTGHPVYSFAVIGSQSSLFDGLDNVSAYGEESPFGLLKQLNGKIGVLDLPEQRSMTLYHHVEEVKQVSYRYLKNFSGNYTDWEGMCTRKTYSLYVRNLEQGVITDVNPSGELLWQAGVYVGDRPGTGTGLRTVNACSLFEHAEALIDSGRALGTLYGIQRAA